MERTGTLRSWRRRRLRHGLIELLVAAAEEGAAVAVEEGDLAGAVGSARDQARVSAGTGGGSRSSGAGRSRVESIGEVVLPVR